METKWLKLGRIKNVILLNKDVIAVASDIHIIFINLNTKEEKVELFKSKERGDGVDCLTGHPVVPIFSVIEKRTNPNISLFTFPEINKVSNCSYKKCDEVVTFISSTFAGNDYLLTLTSFPSFQLIIWYWRSGENIKIVDTNVPDINQQITCSPQMPILIAQTSKTAGKLEIYEMSICSKMILLNSFFKSSNSERIIDSCWTFDGNLLICDDTGSISLIFRDGKRSVIIKFDIGLLNKNILISDIHGKIVVVNDTEIVFYRGSDYWKLMTRIETSSKSIFTLHHPSRNSLLLFTINHEIDEIHFDDDIISKTKLKTFQGSEYLFLVPINPCVNEVALIDNFNCFIVFEVSKGNFISSLSLDSYGKALSVCCHPKVPLIAVSTQSGRCIILNLSNTSEPFVLKLFYLIELPLNLIKFSFNGNNLAIANSNQRDIFLIRNLIEVGNYVKVPNDFVDLLIHEMVDETVVLMVLIKSHLNIGKYLIIYTLNRTTNTEEILSTFELNHTFTGINYGLNFLELIGTPYSTKQLHFIQFTENFREMALSNAISLPHSFKCITINLNFPLILTFGVDGILTVRNYSNVNQTLGTFQSHHLRQGGIKYAVVSLTQGILVILGQNGSVVAVKLRQSMFNSNQNLPSDDCSLGNLKDLFEITDRDNLDEKIPWINCKLENEENEIERAAIQFDLNKLKAKIKQELDKNESDLNLPVELFDLDLTGRKEKTELNMKEKLKLKESLEEKIFSEQEVTKYLYKMCWESMKIPACALISLDGRIRVINYALPFENDDLYRDILLEETFTRTGTVTHKWISLNPLDIVDQFEKDGSYSEGVKLINLTSIREKELKEHFNILFDAMKQQKNIEIKLANERLEKIKYNVKELEEMFNEKYFINNSWLQLKWDKSEKPHTIVKVEDEEVYELIYNSANELNVIANLKVLSSTTSNNNINNNDRTNNSKTVFEKSFQEITLQKLMDGVLEIKWKDVIKKDIVMPDCLSKNSLNYTEEDLTAIKLYESAVKNLEIEKIKYKNILKNNIFELQKCLKENINNFNNNMEILYLKRIKLQSGILQEKLIKYRELKRHRKRLECYQQIKQLKDIDLKILNDDNKRLTNELNSIELTLNDVKLKYENLNKRDKQHEIKFRSEFPDLKQPMIEFLFRHYKKRPRIGQLMCTSLTYLSELNRCIINGEKSEILSLECIDYLKGLNSLDVMPNLPHQIDSNHWHLLTRLRRAKVELEIRLKSCTIELTDAEQTSALYQKLIQSNQMKIQQLTETIERMKLNNEKELSDMEVQLVLKMGQIETDLNKKLNDNVMLISYDEIINVNKTIVETGNKKIKAMNKTLEFKRDILWKEWRHNCLKMMLDDLKEELKFLQQVKITKEIQDYLMTHQDAVKPEKNLLSTTEKRYQRILNDEKTNLSKLMVKINQLELNNSNLIKKINKKQMVNGKLNKLIDNNRRIIHENFIKHKLQLIMKRNIIINHIKNNYDILLNLRNQLELCRLKTYPTLRLKNIPN